MSQLKGLVLPLAMGLAERIVCRLVNTGLWRSWSAFKMLVLSRRCSCMRRFAYWPPPACPVSNGTTTTQWWVGITAHGEICSPTYHIRQAGRVDQNKNVDNIHLRPTMFGTFSYSFILLFLLHSETSIQAYPPGETSSLQYLMYFVQSVWPDSRSSLCDTREQATLPWLQPSGYLTQPLATQWFTQRLIGVLKASYLTHQNNKYCYQAGPSHAWFLCRPRMCLISSLLCVGLCQAAYAHIPPALLHCVLV